MKRLFLLIMMFWVGIVRMVADNTLFYDSKQLTCDLITSICQDKDGFMWIGTDYGLNKFNGIRFFIKNIRLYLILYIKAMI